MSQKLSSVMVATREITNEETGLDLFVYEERRNVASKRTIKTTFYNIIVVSNLLDFHANEGQTVQYTMDKSHDEFEKLYRDLSKKFSGTLFPEVPSKPIILMDTVEKAKDRKQKLDKFIKFCARTPKIAKSEQLLKFLGVDSLKIDDEDDEDQTEGSNEKQSPIQTTKQVRTDLFTESIDTTHDELFAASETADESEDMKQVDNTASKNSTVSTSAVVKLFEDPIKDSDLLEIVVDRDFSEINNKHVEENQEDKEDFFDADDSDDDLEQLMNRLENAKKTREARDKALAERIPEETRKKEKSENDHDLGDLSSSDVARYISENTVKMDDTDLGL